jgi:hypothetical protein
MNPDEYILNETYARDIQFLNAVSWIRVLPDTMYNDA